MNKIGKKWNLLYKGAGDVISRLIQARGIADEERFFRPDFSRDQYKPEDLPNFKPAIDRITSAIKANEVIGIFGDYDTDGIPGTALLFLALQKIGVKNILVHIPRRSDGYGLSHGGIDYLHQVGCKLMITVDCGVTSAEEISYAKSLGMDVVVLDHHEPHDTLPEATLVNAKIKQSKYPFRELCATSVVYKIIAGLAQEYPEQLSESWQKWHLDLVALATICDMVPLIDENRVLAKFGLSVIKKTKNLGIQKLIEIAGLTPDQIDAYKVGFVIGPRINAVGRMDDDPMLGFKLLTSNDPDDAATIAKTLNTHNLNRQDYLLQSIRQAEELWKSEDTNKSSVIVLKHHDWSAGILGLIATRMVERYHKPAFILEDHGGVIKGSARSTTYLSLPDTLEAVKKHLAGYGGHQLAAGLSLDSANYSQFKAALMGVASKKLDKVEQVPHLHIDTEIKLTEINLDLYRQLQLFEPFGLGNPKPSFVLRGVSLSELKTMGSESQHIRGTLENKDGKIGFVGFGMAKELLLLKNELVDVVVSIEENVWRGSSKIELIIKDIKPHSAFH